MDAIVLICAIAIAPVDCTRATALDIVPIAIEGPLCGVAPQQMIAQTGLLASAVYQKTVCIGSGRK